MAFTATIDSITPMSNDGSTVSLLVDVAFADSASGFAADKTYTFPVNTTQASAVSTITADGQAFKTALASLGNLQNKVGTVITI